MKILSVFVVFIMGTTSALADTASAYNKLSGKVFHCSGKFEGTFKTERYTTLPDRVSTAVGCARYLCESDSQTKYSFECVESRPRYNPSNENMYSWKGNFESCLIARKEINEDLTYKAILICEQTIEEARLTLANWYSQYLEIENYTDRDARFCKDYGRTCLPAE